ncbi:MAG: LicD family protein [Clostridia bacterium]|nr:LicD family protein [Clostridia bacterium]
MEQLERVHKILFDTLKAVKNLCEKYDIQYNLDGGTLLGAVRHKDFIPWDDDADITMKRDEYIKFIAVAHELPAPYKFVRPDEYGGYFFDFVPRVLNMDEPLREETPEDTAQNNYQNRVAVDIFVLEDAPASKLSTRVAILRQKILYGYGMAHRYPTTVREHSFVDKLKIGVLKTIGKTMSLEKIFKKHEKSSTKHHGKAGEYYFSSNAIMKEVDILFKREAYAKSVMLPLGDELFSCPADWDHVLTSFYGDYMTPPKEEDRRPMHI